MGKEEESFRDKRLSFLDLNAQKASIEEKEAWVIPHPWGHLEG
jgi:hypothetical protein